MTVIYKNKGDPKDIKNYRPISLTVVAYRIFEKIIDSKLDDYKPRLHTTCKAGSVKDALLYIKCTSCRID